MARRVARCGTESGYRRHLRLREQVCDACREAKRVAVRRQRGADAPAGTAGASKPAGVAAAGKASLREADLLRQRKALWGVLGWAMEHQPLKVPSVSSELRAVNAELEALSASGAVVEKSGGGLSDELAAARAARASRTEGVDSAAR